MFFLNEDADYDNDSDDCTGSSCCKSCYCKAEKFTITNPTLSASTHWVHSTPQAKFMLSSSSLIDAFFCLFFFFLPQAWSYTSYSRFWCVLIRAATGSWDLTCHWDGPREFQGSTLMALSGLFETLRLSNMPSTTLLPFTHKIRLSSHLFLESRTWSQVFCHKHFQAYHPSSCNWMLSLTWKKILYMLYILQSK